MRRWVYEQSLSIFFLALFLLSVLGQWIVGAKAYNAEQTAHGEEAISYGRYFFSSDFGGNLLENWQSEFLQFLMFIYVTIWLVQKGSNESKELGEAGEESDQKQLVGGYAPENGPAWARLRGWRLGLYQHSLMLVIALMFLGSWLGQSVGNWTEYNDGQTAHGDPTVSWLSYVVNPDFWNRTKPVGSPHGETAASG